jgi:hypothetical protein
MDDSGGIGFVKTEIVAIEDIRAGDMVYSINFIPNQ